MPLNIGNSVVRVQPYFGFRNESRMTISARALKGKEADFKRAGRWRAIRTMMSQFASREVEGLGVRLEAERSDGARFTHHAETDAEGFVHFDIPLEGDWSLTGETDWEVVALHWQHAGEGHCIEGHVLTPGEQANLGIISDIDDTILETGITGGLGNLLRNLKRVIAQLPDERIAVPGADVFYGALGGGAPLAPQAASTGKRLPATKRPFFYVSSSPWNLYSYLVAFKRSRSLPLGPIVLRDWSLSRETLGSAGHGAHKRAAIERILSSYPNLKFALIGDDTQGDLAAFGDTVKRYPERIAAVFIRRAAGLDLSAEEQNAQSIIEAAGVPLWLGDDYRTGEDFLATIGLASDGETEKIVASVEKRDQE